jgi:hypothetical protein
MLFIAVFHHRVVLSAPPLPKRTLGPTSAAVLNAAGLVADDPPHRDFVLPGARGWADPTDDDLHVPWRHRLALRVVRSACGNRLSPALRFKNYKLFMRTVWPVPDHDCAGDRGLLGLPVFIQTLRLSARRPEKS